MERVRVGRAAFRVVDQGSSRGGLNGPILLLSRAVVAAACFPIGLPPFVLDIEKVPSGTSCLSSFTKPGSIYLSDGGVLKNLGVQTRLRSRRFRFWDIVQSDAGALDSDGPGPAYRDRLKSVLIGLLGGWSLQRVMGLMGDKQARWARSEIFDAQGRSWLIDEVREREKQGLDLSEELRAFLGPSPIRKRRRIMFVGLGQKWSSFFKRIPRWRLISSLHELAKTQRRFRGAATPRRLSPTWRVLVAIYPQLDAFTARWEETVSSHASRTSRPRSALCHGARFAA